jgi:hypothetical protein
MAAAWRRKYHRRSQRHQPMTLIENSQYQHLTSAKKSAEALGQRNESGGGESQRGERRSESETSGVMAASTCWRASP